MCFRSCWTSCKLFRIADKKFCSSFEDLGRLWALRGGDCSGSLRRPCFILEQDLERQRWRFLLIGKELNQGNIIPERNATTYPTNETTLKEPNLAIRQTKSMKKGGKKPVYLLRYVARGKRWRVQASAVYYTIAESYLITSCVAFSYPGGTVIFSFILDALTSGHSAVSEILPDVFSYISNGFCAVGNLYLQYLPH